MPFESDRNVVINISVEDRDATARLEKIATSLEKLASTTGGQVNPNLQATATALNKAGRAAQSSRSGFSQFQRNLITLDASLRVVRRGVNAVRNSVAGFFELLGEGQQVEGLTASFDRLQQSIGRDSVQSIQLLRNATQGLVSDLDLFKAANEAVLLKVDDGTGAFERLAAAAVKLGQATGRNAAEAIGDLTQGIGRQSRLILDNLGIVVRAQAAYEAYAESVGVAVKDLSEFEKQAAFTAAATESITSKAAELAEVQDTAGTASLRLSASISNLNTRFVTALSSNTELADAVTRLAQTFDEVDAVALAADIANLSAAFINFSIVVTENAVAALSVFVENAKTAADFIADLRDGVSIGTTAQIRLELEGADEARADLDLAKQAFQDLDNLKLLKIQGEFELTTDNIVKARQAVLELQRAAEGGNLGASLEASVTQARNRLQELVIAANAANISTRGLASDGLPGSNIAMAELAETTAGAAKALRLLENIPLDDTFGKFAEDVGKARVAFSLLQTAQEAGIPLTAEQSTAYTELGAALERAGTANVKLTSAQKALAREQEKFTSSLEQTLSSIGNIPTAAEAAAEGLSGMLVIQRLLSDDTEILAKLIEDFFTQLEKSEGPKAATEALKAFEKVELDLIKSTEKLNEEIEKLVKPLEALDAVGDPLAGLSVDTRAAIEALKDGTFTLEQFEQALKDTAKTSGITEEELEILGSQVDDLADKTKRATEQFKDFFGILGSDIQAFDLENNLGLGDLLDSEIGQAIGANLVAGITSAIEGGDIEESFKSTISGLAGATGTAIAGPVGGAIGTALGDAVGENFSKALDGSLSASIGAVIDTVFFGAGTGIAKGLEAIGVDGLFGGQREDPFRDARNGLQGFIDELQDATGFDLGFDFSVEGFSEVIRSAEEVQEVFGDTFADFTTLLDDGTFKVNEFSLALGEAGQTADRELLATFEGIGTSIAASFGLAGDELATFGQQFGQVLAVNLQDPLGLNRLQLLFQEAGLSAEELGAAIEDAYRRGDISAGEFLNASSKTENLFEQGIPGAVGATDLAFANLATGGLESGAQAMDAFGDLAVEASEKGITSFDALAQSLIESGASVTDVNILFEQLAANGITTIEALKEISLPQAAEMIVDLENVGFGFQEIGDQITNARDLLQQFRAETSQPITQRVNVEFAITGDQEAIDAGLTDPLPNAGDGPPTGRVFFTLSNFSGEQ